MRRDEETLVNPPLQDLLEQIPQKYELVLAATRRAKQILRQQQLNSGGEALDPRFRKPLTLALMDIAEGRVDTQELMQPDVIFDEFEEEQQEFFPELENFNRDEPDEALDALSDGDEDEDDEDEALDEDEMDDEMDLGEGEAEPEQ
jgi:DNA-directed RNA polymerase omega subunit